MGYHALLVNSDRHKAEAHFADNGLNMDAFKDGLRNSSSVTQILHKYDHVDFLYIQDFQMEAFSTTWNKKRSAQYQFDKSLIDLLSQKVMRLHLQLDNAVTLQRVAAEFLSRGWIMTVNLPVNPLRNRCDSQLSPIRQPLSVNKV